MKLYADDSKLIVCLENYQDGINMQRDVNSISKWCRKWSMELNAVKCKIMHTGKTNENRTYSINDGHNNTILENTEIERDLGILVCANGRWSEQATAAASKANRILGMIKRSFKYWSDDVAKVIYPTFVRPHLEFASAVWNPNRRADTKVLERVQHRATKTYESRKLSYEKRLERLNLTTLEKRRHRGDLIQCYKIVHGVENVNWCVHNRIMERCGRANGGRRHNMQLTREIIHDCESRFNFLLNRIATPWNNLPAEVALASSVNAFKNRLDEYLGRVGWRPHMYNERFF